MADGRHPLLHSNLLMLGRFYIHPRDLKSVLKENMFEFPNKTGFEQVMYYLLNIITPTKLRAEVRWPLLCPKDSVVFRNKAKDIMLALNSEYPEAEIPHVTSFVLMSYGGVKLVNLMYKLSFFALQLHAQRTFGNIDKMGTASEMKLSDILKSSHQKLVEYNDLIELSPVKLKDKEDELAELDTALQEKKKELIKLITSSPKEYRDRMYKHRLREDIFCEWKEKIDELAQLNRMKLQNLEKLEAVILKFCSYIEPFTPVIIDGEKLKDKFKTKAVYSFSEQNGLQLLRKSKLSLEALLGLGNCYVKSLLSAKNDNNVVSTDLETVLYKSELSSLIIEDLKTDSEQIYTSLSNLRQSLVSSCLNLNSYIGKTINYAAPVYSDLISTPPVVFSVPEDHNNYLFSPEEGGSPFLQRLRDTYQSVDLTPTRNVRPLRRAMTDMLTDKRVRSLLGRGGLGGSPTRLPIKDHKIGPPRSSTPRTHSRSSPSLIVSAIERRGKVVKRPKTAPEISNQLKVINVANKSPSLTSVEYTEKESKQTISELFSVTSDDEFGHAIIVPQTRKYTYDNYFTGKQSKIGKEKGEQEDVTNENKPTNEIRRNKDIQEIIERYKKIKSAAC